ncbi:MAG: hypothetical protein J6Q13_02995 [Clostridia bacterium]|nr:hypothetical protein [Clostridia bacterium]
MKKGIKNLAIATMVGVVSMGLMTGCKKEEAKPYIQVRGLDVAYFQNEDINLEGAKILYYSDKNDTTADEIKLTESMIANFDTDTIGEKKMKVLWNNFELEINYSVISTTDFINLYNTAYDNLMNANCARGNLLVNHDNIVENVLVNKLNNQIYSNSVYKQDNEVIGETQEWIQKYNNVWYQYIYDENEENQIRRDVSEDILNNNVMECCMNYFIGSGSKLDASALEYIDEICYDIDGTKTILSIKVFDEDYNETNIIEFIIENNKFIGCNAKVENAEGEIRTVSTSIISYNLEDVEMVDLPTDVEWTEE